MIEQTNIGLNSRSEASPFLENGFLPLITAPMYSVVDETNYQTFLDNKIHLCLPRKVGFEGESTYDGEVFNSCSLEEFIYIYSIEELSQKEYVCIDTANGNMPKLHEAIREAKKLHGSNLVIMAGNVSSLEAFEELAETGVDYIRVGIGGGCLAAETRILMREGYYKNITDIKVNDFVINGEGNPVRVIGVKYSGKKKVVKHKHNRFHQPTYVTKDHLHWGISVNRNEEYNSGIKTYLDRNKEKIGWIDLESVEKGLFFLPTKINYDLPPGFSIDLSDNILSNNTNWSKTIINSCYEVGYLFGTFLGDGNSNLSRKRNETRLTSSGQLTWYFNITEEQHALKVKEYCKKIFELDVVFETKNNVIKVHLYCQPLARFFRSFYDVNKKKRLPKQFYCLDKNYLQGLYDGLIDSDGTWGNEKEPRDSFVNTSSHLIELMCFVNNVLTDSHGNCEYSEERITNFGLSSSFKWRKNKVEERREWEQYSIVKSLYIDTIEETIDTYDIEVDCPTHSFIANNCIVHNSSCNTTSNTGVGQMNLESLIEQCDEFRANKIQYRDFPTDYREAERNPFKVKIVADGISSYIKQCESKYGFNDNGYAAINKLLFAGADLVMVGKLFAQCLESAGEKKINHTSTSNPKLVGKDFMTGLINGGKKLLHYKDFINDKSDWTVVKYSGMSTKEEQVKYKGESTYKYGVYKGNGVLAAYYETQKEAEESCKKDKGYTWKYLGNIKPSEGTVQWIPVRWTLQEWLHGSQNQDAYPYLMGWVNSIKSAMSYTGITKLYK